MQSGRTRPVTPVLSLATAAVLTAVFLTILPRSDATAETFIGTTVDSRVLVGVRAEASALQAFMPEGWNPITLSGGPFKGANLIIVLIDQEVGLDSEGKRESPSSLRAVAFSGLAKQKDGEAVRGFMFRVYMSEGESDACPAAKATAEIGRKSATSGPAMQARNVSDEWTIAPSEGGELKFTLSYKSGNRNFASGEIRTGCAFDPKLSQVYRTEQMTDLVMSRGIGKPISGEFKLTSSIPEYSKIFDGSEEVVAIIDLPSFVRKMYLP